MKIFRPKTEQYHNWEDHPNEVKNYFKKGFWKKSDRKKFFKRLFKQIKNEQID